MEMQSENRIESVVENDTITGLDRTARSGTGARVGYRFGEGVGRVNYRLDNVK